MDTILPSEADDLATPEEALELFAYGGVQGRPCRNGWATGPSPASPLARASPTVERMSSRFTSAACPPAGPVPVPAVLVELRFAAVGALLVSGR